MENRFKELQDMINECNNIVFFGGAGVSTASGIPDFRSEDGLYNGKQQYRYKPEVMLSHSFFINNTYEFFNFYRDKMCATDYEPNITHKKLAELEEKGKLKAVITQNIDGLHQKAGSKNVIELHGTIYRNYCTVCKREYPVEYVKNNDGIPKCQYCNLTRAIVRPDITLYEEQLPAGAMDKAVEYVSQADMLIIAGTSLAVYPAANLVDSFEGKYLVVINKGKIDRDTFADLYINGDMTEVFKNLQI